MKLALIGSDRIKNFPRVSMMLDAIVVEFRRQYEEGVIRPHHIEIITMADTLMGHMGKLYASSRGYMHHCASPQLVKASYIIDRATHCLVLVHPKDPQQLVLEKFHNLMLLEPYKHSVLHIWSTS